MCKKNIFSPVTKATTCKKVNNDNTNENANKQNIQTHKKNQEKNQIFVVVVVVVVKTNQDATIVVDVIKQVICFLPGPVRSEN